MNAISDHDKVCKIISSCETMDQLGMAIKIANRFRAKSTFLHFPFGAWSLARNEVIAGRLRLINHCLIEREKVIRLKQSERLEKRISALRG